MRFVVQQKVLSEALGIVGRVITGKSLIPILDNIRFEIAGSMCKLTASNNTMFISKMIELDQESDMIDVAIEAATLIPVIKTSEPGLLTFDVILNDSNVITSVNISTASSKEKCEVIAESGDNFLRMPHEGVASYTLNGPSFMDALSRSTAFVNPNDSKIVKHINVRMGNGIEIIATDTYKVFKKLVHENTVNRKDILISYQEANILSRIECTEDLGITYSERDVIFTMTNGTTITCRLQDGNYPDFDKLIPTDFKGRASVSLQKLLKATKRCDIFHHFAEWSFTEEGLTIEAVDYDRGIGKCTEVIPCDFHGEPFKIHYTGSHMLTVLSNIKSENVEFFTAETKNPLSLKEENVSSKEFLMLIMPVVL